MLAVRAVYPVLSSGQPAGAPNQWPCTIARRIFSGDFVEYLVEASWGQLTVRRPPGDRFAEGSSAVLTLDPNHCVVIDR
jgi:hypothetical protein